MRKYLLLLTVFFLAPAFAKNEQSVKIDKAIKMIQEAMILLKEVSTTIDEQEVLDPSNFQRALDSIKEGKYEQAKQTLIVFSKGNDEKALQALYWLGVCFLEEKNYEKAMVTFVSFLNKIEDAELTGMNSDMKKSASKYLVRCFERLYRPIDACAVVSKIEKEYPNEVEYVNNAR